MSTKATKATIEVRVTAIAVIRHLDDDYISLTDIAKAKNSDRPDT